VRHRNVRDEPRPEEALLARMGAVDELIDDDERAGRKLLLERATGGNRNYIGNAGALQGIDVGAVVDGGGRLHVTAAMTRQEHHLYAGKPSEQQFVRRRAPRALDALPARVLEARDVI